jgi:phosphoenolpyruvate---glycerone phosphotransferase subunit DhaL
MSDKITAAQMMQIIGRMCDTIEQQKDYLSELDGALGDGDHGVNMAKCFREVRKKLPQNEGKDIGALLKSEGMVVLNSTGGAMGALYGTMFLKWAGEAAGKTEIDLNDLIQMFKAAEAGIRTIGKAEVGDKTLLDTLSPAVAALEKAQQEGRSLPDALANFEQAARQGMESTRDLLARMGRASRLGERTIGHQDAGATSCYFLLRAFVE